MSFFTHCSDTVSGGYAYQVHQNHSVFFHPEDSEEMYIGGTDFVLKLDMNDYHVIEVGELLFYYLFFTFFISPVYLQYTLSYIYLKLNYVLSACYLCLQVQLLTIMLLYQMVATAQLFSVVADRYSFSAIFGFKRQIKLMVNRPDMQIPLTQYIVSM